jgi:hypothetical protein
MVKEGKFFRKQAAKAEHMALTVSDAAISERILSLAKAYRSQAKSHPAASGCAYSGTHEAHV